MNSDGCVVVVGLGEIGKPLLQLLSERFQTAGVDIAPVAAPEHVSVMHICYPYQIADFVGETERYIRLFKPVLTVINSTVAIGTSREIARRTGAAIVNSPVRGKHAHMLDDLRFYTKFIGALDPETGAKAVQHFAAAGLRAQYLGDPETTELAKLTETTYFGLLIAWAQELERYCDVLGISYEEVVTFYKEIGFLPRVSYFPGVIGGHCVMPNIRLLSQMADSDLLRAIVTSNAMKVDREQARLLSTPVHDTVLTTA